MMRLKNVSTLAISLCTIAIIIILLLTYYGENVGDFTINLDKESFQKYGLSLSETADFQKPTSTLVAKSYEDTDPIGNITDYPNEIIPEEILYLLDNGLKDGSNNGEGFMAYTFYLKNSGSLAVHYDYSIVIKEVVTNIDAALRVMIVQERNVNSEDSEEMRYLYAKSQDTNGKNPGEPELGTIPFESASTIFKIKEEFFEPGQIDRYSVILWVEGHDIDCTNVGENSIVHGIIKLSMEFELIKIDNYD